MKNIILFLGILFFTFETSAQEKLQYKLEDLEQIQVDTMIIRNPGELGEKQIIVLKNQLIPWDGYLLNPEAVTIIVTEYENLLEKTKLSLEAQRKADLAKLNLETGKLRLELDALQKKSNIQIAGRDAELQSCQKINKKILEDRSHIRRKIYVGLGSGAAGLVIGTILSIFLF